MKNPADEAYAKALIIAVAIGAGALIVVGFLIATFIKVWS